MELEKNYHWHIDAPLVIAHRGASSIAPENTVPAFKLAVELGADAIELDLKLSSDGTIIVHHDLTLDRTTNGVGRIADWEWSELKGLDAGLHKGRDYKGVGIPRLIDVFEALGNQVLYNLELSEYSRPWTDLTRRTVELVKSFHLQPYVLYSSFSLFELFRLLRYVERTQIALLMHERTPSLFRTVIRLLTPHRNFHPSDRLTSRDLIRRTQAKSKRVNVWTVNQSKRIQNLMEWGVNGIITDDPDLALQIRQELGNNG